MAEERRRGFYTHETRRFANKLPQWHAGRQRVDSNYHELLNAAYGIQSERYKESFDSFIDNSFLKTSRLNDMDVISKASIPGTFANRTLPQYNFLENSNFFYATSPLVAADLWLNEGTARVSPDGTWGPNSMELIPVSLTVTQISQYQITSAPAGSEFNLSAYIKVDSFDTTGMVLPTSNYGVKAIVQYDDDTTETFHGVLNKFHTGGEWTRVDTVVSSSKTVTRITAYCVVESTALFDIPVNVKFDGVQLSDGSSLKAFQPRRDDIVPFNQTFAEPISFFFIDSERPVYRILDEVDFWVKAIPTASSIVSSGSTVGVENNISESFPVIDFFDFEFQTEFEMDRTAKTLELKNSETQSDEIYATFTLNARNSDGLYEDISMETFEAISAVNTWICIVGNKTDQAGETKKYLNVVNPRTFVSPYPDNLQVMNSFELPIDSSEVVLSAEFKNNDQQHIYISTATTEYVVRLHYDYYLVNFNDGELFLREFYEEFNLF